MKGPTRDDAPLFAVAYANSGEGDVIGLAFEGMPVRTAKVDGEPFFVGKDVAECLGYAQPADAIYRLCKGSVKRIPLQTPGGMQEVRVLAEPDVMRLIMGSKLRAAQRFERWVFEGVEVRTVKRGIEPWWVLADVCGVLGVDNVGNAAARLDEDERISIRNPDVNPGRGNPNLIVINESGLYSLILTSRKPCAADSEGGCLSSNDDGDVDGETSRTP